MQNTVTQKKTLGGHNTGNNSNQVPPQNPNRQQYVSDDSFNRRHAWRQPYDYFPMFFPPGQNFAPYMQQAARIEPNELPAFWPQSLTLWFKAVEAVFDSKIGLTDDVKFNAIIRRLSHEQLTAVEHIIDNPPPANKYEALKEALLSKYAASQEEQFRTLISSLQLTGKPSELYEQMRRHGKDLPPRK